MQDARASAFDSSVPPLFAGTNRLDRKEESGRGQARDELGPSKSMAKRSRVSNGDGEALVAQGTNQASRREMKVASWQALVWADWATGKGAGGSFSLRSWALDHVRQSTRCCPFGTGPCTRYELRSTLSQRPFLHSAWPRRPIQTRLVAAQASIEEAGAASATATFERL